MATVAANQKKKCTYWDKCYRKNKQHLEEFLHPGDIGDEDSTKTTAKNDSDSKNTSPKPRLVHDISVSDDDNDKPAWKKNGKRKPDDEDVDDKSAKKSPAPSTSATTPVKKMKLDDANIEKITVNYNKPKTKKESNSDKPTTSKADEDDSDKSSDSKPKNKKIIEYTAKREKCKYWDKCYQTNENHLKEFYHPGDDVPKNDESDKKTRTKTKAALNPLEDGDSVKFNTGCILKREGDVYSCSCSGFTSQTAPDKERTCKHLKEYLGEEFEKQRIGQNSPKKAPIPSHINVKLLLAHKYDEKVHNPIGWWISEKLDGVRAYWNGRCFYSRLGNAFYAPEWFTKDLPKDIHLDGELFSGRGEFQSTVSIVKTPDSPRWKDIKYYVFDGPHMGKDTFEKRMNTIVEYFEDVQPQYAVFVEQTKCVSKEQLDQMLTRILNIGGEGLMIRQPTSIYEATRSKTLLKIKKFYDAEAIVIAHERGKGVNQNRCGALRCRMACGKEFSVGSGLTDKDRNHPPKIGSIITYKFQELSKGGSPRFPTYVGIRIDMTEPKDAEIREVLDEDEA